MYITQEIAARIKQQAKEKQIPIKDLMSNCEMNINALSEFAKGKRLSCISLARIADYLGCSVDYLLGRESFGDSISVSASTINGSAVVQGKQTGSFVINNTLPVSAHNEEENELVRILNTIGVKGKTELMSFAFALEEKYKGINS